MAARGIKVNWDEGGTVSYVSHTATGANRLNLAGDVTLMIWMNMRGDKSGAGTSDRGYVALSIHNSSPVGCYGRVECNDCDQSFQHEPWTVAGRYMDSSFAQADFADTGDTIRADDDNCYVLQWDASAGTWSFLHAIDGDSLALDGASSAIAITGGELFDVLRVFWNGNNTQGANAEATNLKVWTRLLDENQLNAEKESASVVDNTNLWEHWPLLNAADLTGAANSRVLTVTGTVTDGAMDPLDLQASGRRVFTVT